MFWEIMFWLSIAVGVLIVILRVLVPAFHKPAPAGARAHEDRKPRGNILTHGIVLPIVVVLVMAYSFLVKAYPEQVPVLEWSDINIFSTWSDEEKVEVRHLSTSIDYYQNATMLAVKTAKTDEDWESVKALLIAALDESNMVSDKILEKVDDDLPEEYNKNFKPGLRIGIYAIDSKPTVTEKVKPTEQQLQTYSDSLDASRELLTNWATWYEANSTAIQKKIKLD